MDDRPAATCRIGEPKRRNVLSAASHARGGGRNRPRRPQPPKYWYPNHAQPCSNQFLRAAGQAEYPPSWYLDPAHAGGLRWWDGSQWTGHTARPIWPATKPE